MNTELIEKDGVQYMTAKQIAEVMGMEDRQIRRAANNLHLEAKGVAINGHTTFCFTKEQVAAIQRHIQSYRSSDDQHDLIVTQEDIRPAVNTLYQVSASDIAHDEEAAQALVQKAMEVLKIRMDDLHKELEITKARVQIADSFRTIDRYINENNISLEACEAAGLGKGMTGIGLKLSRWFKEKPDYWQLGKVTEVNVGKYTQKSYQLCVLDEYFAPVIG